MKHPYTKDYIKEHMDNFMKFVHAVRNEGYADLNMTTLAILYTDMRRA